jgi:hypothetical protein
MAATGVGLAAFPVAIVLLAVWMCVLGGPWRLAGGAAILVALLCLLGVFWVARAAPAPPAAVHPPAVQVVPEG